MASKSVGDAFSADWEKTAAWAQTQGITSKSYYPVYQMDASRVLAGESPMSTSERTRAILAAANPNSVTPVPSDHPSPWSFFGNAVSDLRNIFTGLAPNHLIPNVFNTVESAIIHPETWLKPIQEVGTGVLTGNEADIKKGLEGAGTGILSWIPGVYDLSEVASGGWQALLEHPVVSFLDVAPFAPAGRILDLAASDARIAAVASKMGMTRDEFMKASVPKMGTSFILSRDVAKIADDGTQVPRFPGIGALTKGVLVDRTGKVRSLGDTIKNWADIHTGLSKNTAEVAAAAWDLKNYGTEAELAIVRPFQLSEAELEPAQRQALFALDQKTDPRAIGKSVAEVMADSSIDQKVRDAYGKLQDVRDMSSSRALASGGLVERQGPDYVGPDGKVHPGQTEMFGANGADHAVVAASRQFKKALANLLEAMGPSHRITQEVALMDQQADELVGQLNRERKAAQEEAISGRVREPVKINKNGKVTEWASLDLAKQAQLLFGDAGLIDKMEEAMSPVDQTGKPKQQDFETLKALAEAAARSLSKDGYASIDASNSPVFAQVLSTVENIKDYATARVARERQFLKELKREDSKSFRKQLAKAIEKSREFDAAWWDHPADRWRPLLYDKMVEQILSADKKTKRIGEMDKVLRAPRDKGGRGWTEQQIKEAHQKPEVMAQLIWQETKNAASNVNGRAILDAEEMERIYTSAVEEVNVLRQAGHEVTYTPVISTHDVKSGAGEYGINLAHPSKIRDLSSTKGRVMDDFMPERHDIVASVHMAAKEALQRDITIEFAQRVLAPHAITAGELSEWAQKAFPQEYAGLDPAIQNSPDLLNEQAARMGLVKWDPETKFGFSFPKWQGTSLYLPKGLGNAVDDLLEKRQFPMDGAYDKATGLFRFSILGLSPRYTAHIVFGGSMMLALRSSPRALAMIPDAFRMVKHGEMPTRIVQGATDIGVDAVKYRSFEDKTRDTALRAANHAGGAQMGTMAIQGELTRSGLDWRKANPVQWLKAAGDVNFRFTNYVVKLQRSLAYLDAASKAGASFVEDEDGHRVLVTPERAKEIGVQHSLKVMGDLKAMTPFERRVMVRIMPFYGWTRHVLDYVLTYPVDHPYRAQFLAVLASQDSNSVAAALDKRIQFMFFFGSPDSQGNVSGVDVRFLDPFRDVANYATLGGWISALNPVLAAPLAMADPSIIYGSQSLYPNVTYDQFYGIETATAGGSPLSAAEQIVPQLGALDQALNLSGQYRSQAITNPNGFAKGIFEALNIPFAQVQNLNMKQLAAKGQNARYEVAKQLATDAFATGDFGPIKSLPTVPDPLNAEYNITPGALEQLYNTLQTEYPGSPPSETATPPPPLSL